MKLWKNKEKVFKKKYIYLKVKKIINFIFLL